MRNEQQIIASALELFLARGVKGTSLDAVAHRAGVTRVTVYRHFRDKKGLVSAVCRHIADVFRAADRNCREGEQDVGSCLRRVGRALHELPDGRLFARLEEIGRLYPEVYDEFRAARTSAIDGIFEWLLDVARREGVLREDLDFQVVRAVFWEAVVRLGENPAIVSSGVPPAEIFETVARVFRQGILREKGEQ